MKIRHIRFDEQVFRFTHGEYVMSHVTQTQLNPRLLRLETDDGNVGWGEIIRKSHYNETAPLAEDKIIESLAGASVTDIPVLVGKLRQQDETLRGLAFALDTAYLDWAARKAGLPLYALLGGQLTKAVPEYYSLSGGDPELAGATLKSEARDWKVVQIKLGVGDRLSDIAMVAAALESLSEDQLILADFNGALDVETALSTIAEFDDDRLVWEEPCPSVEENTRVAVRCDKPVMFDQCLADLPSIFRVATAGIAHSVCIKPAFLGGLEVARVARDICVEAGMPVRIDGPWCGHIATAANLHLACGVPADMLIAGCDLRQPLIIDQDWGGTLHLPGHRIAPFDEPGHGIDPAAWL